MPSYTYKAKDRQGQLVTGTLEADTRASVTSRLQSMGYFPVDIRGGDSAPAASVAVAAKPAKAAPKAVPKPAAQSGSQAAAKTGGKLLGLRQFGSRIKARNLTTFYRQMSDLVGAGVPLVKALSIVKSQSGDPALATLIAQVDRDVQAGDTFAKALERHPKVFNRLTTAMIHAGESGGLLEEVLSRLADFAESEEELKSKVKSALAYPVIMAGAGAIAVGVLITFVIPKIVGVFSELSQGLPFITQLLISVTTFLGKYWYMIVGGLILGFILIKRYISTPTGKLQFDALVLRLPLLGEVFLKREIARFTRTLGALLRNGVPILNALTISGEVLGNDVIRAEIEKVPDGIAEGKGISGTLRTSQYFPPVVINMIAIGEETGNLPGVLLKVAGTYEGQVDRSVKTLTSVIEPIIILVMGLVVGFIVISMLLPIFQLDPTGK